MDRFSEIQAQTLGGDVAFHGIQGLDEPAGEYGMAAWAAVEDGLVLAARSDDLADLLAGDFLQVSHGSRRFHGPCPGGEKQAAEAGVRDDQHVLCANHGADVELDLLHGDVLVHLVVAKRAVVGNEKPQVALGRGSG